MSVFAVINHRRGMSGLWMWILICCRMIHCMSAAPANLQSFILQTHKYHVSESFEPGCALTIWYIKVMALIRTRFFYSLLSGVNERRTLFDSLKVQYLHILCWKAENWWITNVNVKWVKRNIFWYGAWNMGEKKCMNQISAPVWVTPVAESNSIPVRHAVNQTAVWRDIQNIIVSSL